MRKLLTLLFGLTLLFSCSQSELPFKFIHLLDRAKMIFAEPDEYQRIDSLPNNKMNWELAYLHPYVKLEVRYAIQPMDVLLKEYQKHVSKKDSVETIAHPNKLYYNTFKAALLNISDGQLPDYTVFSSKAAKNEFNADWAANALVNVGKEFGNGYKYCFFVFIHKDNSGDAFIYFLADDLKLLDKEMVKIIHNLKFTY